MNLVPVFIVGLLGSGHCLGMCGGIVGALSVAPGRAVPVVTSGAEAASGPVMQNVLAYNAGRLSSYMAAGALAGGVGQGAGVLVGVPAVQAGAYWLANLMLLALGLYMMDAWHGLARLEQGGQLLWRRVRPLLRRIGPLDGPGRMLAAGAVWGWLPCGMVYSMLVVAMLSGSALSGALVMLAFGLGTLPLLLALGVLGARARAWLGRKNVRRAGGALVLGFALAGLARAAAGLPQGWIQDLCVAAVR